MRSCCRHIEYAIVRLVNRTVNEYNETLQQTSFHCLHMPANNPIRPLETELVCVCVFGVCDSARWCRCRCSGFRWSILTDRFRVRSKMKRTNALTNRIKRKNERCFENFKYIRWQHKVKSSVPNAFTFYIFSSTWTRTQK